MRSRAFIPWLGFVILVMVASIMLVPSHEEIALMKMKNADFGEAYKRYSALQSRGDKSINVLVPLIKLHLLYGDIDKAIALVQEFIQQNPHSTDGHRQLAQLYKASQRFHHYCLEMEKLYELAPSTAILRDLANTYHFLGRYKEEMQALARMVARDDYRLQEDDFIKLATYYRVNRQPDEAIAILDRFIDEKEYDVRIDTIRLASYLLLEKGEEKKALILAQHYTQKFGRQYDMLLLASLFQQQGKLDSAYALLVPFLPAIDRSTGVLHMLVDLQLARGRGEEVYPLLHRRFVEGTLPEGLVPALTDLAIDRKDYVLVETVLQTAPLNTLPADALLRYADLTFYIKRPDLAKTMITKLGTDFLRGTPLLQAVLEIHAGNNPKALANLLNVPPGMIATTEQKLIVGNIYLRHRYPKQALALIDGLPLTNIMSALDPREFTQLYLDSGAATAGRQRLEEARLNASSKLLAAIEQAQLLFNAGEGKAEDVQRWFKTHPSHNPALLSAGYDIAMLYGHRSLATSFAQRIYDAAPTGENRLQLAEALLAQERYGEALSHLQALSKHDPKVRKTYLYALADWVRKSGNDDDPMRSDTVRTFLASALTPANMSLDEKRNLAYLLSETGFQDKAETIFIELAADQPFNSPDVNELLGFWGERLPPAAVGWLEHRARTAYGSEKAAWLTYLNHAGYSKNVLDIVGSERELSSPELADVYIDALANLHSRGTLRGVLTREIRKESDPARLRQLAVTARNEDLEGISTLAWRKIHEVQPSNAEALKELGLLAFAANRYSEAQQYLEQYLKRNRPDYRVNYTYAEILHHKGKKDKAKAYFSRAHQQLAESQSENLSAQLDEARLLYRTDRLKESLNLYRKLLARYPENKTIRADFAEMLIATKQFKEASHVLSP